MRVMIRLLSLSLCLFLLFLFVGCLGGKSQQEENVPDTTANDTLQEDTIYNDTADVSVPKAADELFDDFIFNYLGNDRLQMSRTVFPLKVTTSGEGAENTRYVKKGEWTLQRLFMPQGYYTIICDTEEHLSLANDTTIRKVAVQRIDMQEEVVDEYLFSCHDGRWVLASIRKMSSFDAKDESFLRFFRQFACDEAFQLESLNNPVMFTSQDPDDDFSTMTGEIAVETWPAFAPELPGDVIYNIRYGDSYSDTDKRIFVLRGISNGFETRLTFTRDGDDWQLQSLVE